MCNFVDHLYYEPLRAVIPFLFLKYYNEYKRLCQILWADSHSGLSALKGYGKYILWGVLWPAGLSKDNLENMVDWYSEAAPRRPGQCVMATASTLKFREENSCLPLGCVCVYSLTPQQWQPAHLLFPPAGWGCLVPAEILAFHCQSFRQAQQVKRKFLSF